MSESPARVAASAHPVATCPLRSEHLRAAEQIERLEREQADLDRRIDGRAGSIGRRFDRLLGLMGDFGYVDGWRLSAKGRLLARTYHECDLLVAEALSAGLFDDVDPPTLAGMVSCLTYEHRSKDAPPPPRFPSTPVRHRCEDLAVLADGLNRAERAAGLLETRSPDPTFFALAHAWAAGEPLEDVLADLDVSGGDFVRNVKQLIDLLRQLGDHAPVRGTASAARAAAEGLLHGVVAASSVSAATGQPDEDELLSVEPEGEG